MICALIYCMCYLYLQFIWPCLEIKSEFFTTRKKANNKLSAATAAATPILFVTYQLSSTSISGIQVISVNQSGSLLVTLLTCWPQRVISLCSKTKRLLCMSFAVEKKNQLTALNNAHWLKLGLTCLTQPGKHNRYLWTTKEK